MLRSKIELPPDYYYQNFLEFYNSARGLYPEDYFKEDELNIFSAFENLSHQSKLLFIRIIGRKHAFIFKDKLNYLEIPEINRSLQELEMFNLITLPSQNDYYLILSLLPKNELIELVKDLKFNKSCLKNDLVDFVLENISFNKFSTSKICHEKIYKKNFIPALSYLQFLKYGNVQLNINALTLRDLGVWKSRKRRAYRKRFTTPESARHEYFFAYKRGLLKKKDLDLNEHKISDFPKSTGDKPTSIKEKNSIKEKYLAEISKLLITNGDYASAAEYLKLSSQQRNIETYIRTLAKTGDSKTLKSQLAQIIKDPPDESLYLFAVDFYERKFDKKKTSYLTDALRAADEITIDFKWHGRPERGAINYFQSQAKLAYKAENRLWITLFYILFWDELFCRGAIATASEFDQIPLSLTNGSFYRENKKLIDERLATSLNYDYILENYAKVFAVRAGRSRVTYRSSEYFLDVAKALLHNHNDGFAKVLTNIAKDFKGFKSGYPDLISTDSDFSNLEFIEVKSPGDTLKAEQLNKIRFLNASGLKAKILKTKWQIQDHQTYSIVDIETTGGKSRNHRITEIGIVKIRGGEEIDRFHTLINPERKIPKNITKLTGIDDELVKDAPKFHQIADQLMTFLDDTVFIAHSVNFDYGFITQELKRIGHWLHLPKACSCVAARRAFPGLDSYSLGNLADHFDIRLDNHHRALADAEATAELFIKIYNKNPYNLIYAPN